MAAVHQSRDCSNHRSKVNVEHQQLTSPISLHSFDLPRRFTTHLDNTNQGMVIQRQRFLNFEQSSTGQLFFCVEGAISFLGQ